MVKYDIPICGKPTRHGDPCHRPRAEGRDDCGHNDHSVLSTSIIADRRMQGTDVGQSVYTWLEHVVPQTYSEQHSLVHTPDGVKHLQRKRKIRLNDEFVHGSSELYKRKMRLTGHASLRMGERQITEDDVRAVLREGFLHSVYGRKQRWHAQLASGRDVGVVVSPTWLGKCRVITVMVLDGEDEDPEELDKN